MKYAVNAKLGAQNYQRLSFFIPIPTILIKIFSFK